MNDHKYIAVDLGAESGRVMLGRVSQGGIALEEAHRFPNLQIKVGETLHWDILRLWHEIKVGMGKISCEHDVEGVGVDTWGVDFGLMDARGELIGNPVCYRDRRTEGMVEAVFATMSKERIYSVTGIQTMALNTLFQLASLRFQSGGVSEQLGIAKRILFLPDLISYWMSGVMGTDYTFASTSQMLDARKRDWSEEVLKVVGIGREMFAPMSFPGEKGSVRGMVMANVDERLAAKKVPVIAVGGHDTASAIAAVPADSAGGDWLYLSSGTWSLLGVEVDEPVLTERAAFYNVTNEGGVGGKIRLLKNIAGLWLLQECRREWTKRGTELDYATLTAMASEAHGLEAILDLEDPIFATTGEMPEKILAYCRRTGQREPLNPSHFTRVILESLAKSYAKYVKVFEELTGKQFRVLHIVGGGSQNDLLNQLAADATGLKVMAGPVEATALGNVMTQAVTMGVLGSITEGRKLVGKAMGARMFMPGGRGTTK